MSALLFSALLVGLLGSLHCAGMCGPLAVAVSCGHGDDDDGGGGGPTTRLGLFLAGKLLTYAALGAAAGAVGAAFGSPALGAGAFGALALVAGVLMVWLGGRSLWKKRRGGEESVPGPVDVLLEATLKKRRLASSFLAGNLTGLLPCGMVYAMVAQSLVAGTALGGALVMAAFGAGTSPSLLAAGLASRFLSGRARGFGEKVAGAAVIVMGLVALWRGASLLLADPAAGQILHGHRHH